MPANFDQPQDVVKRTRLVDSQFANVKRTRFADGQVLKVKRTRFIPTQYVKRQDFIDDQAYLLERQRRPHRLLRVSGICEGLTVAVQNNQVTVAPGTALDRQGWLIVLSDPYVVDLQNHTGDVDIFISYWNEGADMTQLGTDRSASVSIISSGGSALPRTGQTAAEAPRWLEETRIEAVKDRSALKGENPVWLGRVTVTVSGTNRTVALTTLTEREYSGIYLPSSANPFEGPVLRSGGNPNPKLAVLTGDLRIRGTTADNTAASLNVTNSNPVSPSLLYVRNDGNVGIGTTTPAAKLAINGGLHVGGDSDPGDNNLLVDGTLAVTGNSTLTGSLRVNNAVVISGGKMTLDGAQQIIFTNADTTNNLKLQLWTGYGLGINGSTLFYAANGNHSWRDNNGAAEIMLLTTAATGGLSVKGTGASSFAGSLSVGSALAVTGNSTLTGSLTVNNTVSLKGSASTTGLSVDASGDVTMGGTLNFGATVRQMISLWKFGNSNYGIGIQNGTQYFRTDKNFAWYKGGAHADGELSPGAIGSTNGTVQMFIKDGNVGIGTTPPTTTTPVAKLAINGGLHVGGDSDPGDNNLLVDGTLAVTGNSTLTGSLTVNNAVSLKGSASTTGLSVDTSGNVALGGTLAVTGNSTLTGSLTVNNTVSLKGSATGVGLSVDANGNVGIGTTTTPGAKLDVEGAAMLGYESNITNFGSALKSGFYQNGGQEITGDVPDTAHGWTHLITARHSNKDNNHQLQIAASYESNDRLFFRKIAGTGITNPGWNEVATRAANTFSGNQTIQGTITATKLVGDGAIIAGIIVMWSGAANAVPAGWVLCNGQNNTPDLRNRFIMGTDANTAFTDTSRQGGASSHAHQTNKAGSHRHGFGGGGSMSLNTSLGGTTIYDAGEHEHTITNVNHLPPYFALAFIMKT